MTSKKLNLILQTFKHFYYETIKIWQCNLNAYLCMYYITSLMYEVHILLQNVPSGCIQSLTSSHDPYCYQAGPLVQLSSNWFFCFSPGFLFPSLFSPCREILLQFGSDFVSVVLHLSLQMFLFSLFLIYINLDVSVTGEKMMMKHYFGSRKLSPSGYHRGKRGKGGKKLMPFLKH